MGFLNQFQALFKKNIILWYRNLFGSLCEIIFPIFLMVCVVLIRVAIKNKDYDAKSYVETHSFIISPDLNVQKSALGQSLGETPNPYMYEGIIAQHFPFVRCLDQERYLFGIVADNPENTIFLNKVWDIIEVGYGEAAVAKFLADAPELLKTAGVNISLAQLLGSQAINIEKVKGLKRKDFESGGDLEDYVSGESYDAEANGDHSDPPLCGAIQVDQIKDGTWKIKIRYDDDDYDDDDTGYQQVPSTKMDVIDMLERSPNLEYYEMYQKSGFLYVMTIVENVILGEKSGSDANLTVSFVPMMTEAYVQDDFLQGTRENMPLFMVLAYIAPIFRLISMVVSEKESKVREGMKMMGLMDRAYWTSWTVHYLGINLVICSACTGILFANVYEYSNWFLLWLLFLLFGMALYAFGLFLASLFNRARIAAITGTMVYFASYLLITVVGKRDIAEGLKNLSSLFPTLAICHGTVNFVRFELTKDGLQWDNIGEYVENYRFSMCLWMLVIAIFFWGLLALYIDNIMPTPDGVRKPFYYFLTKSYWTGSANSDGITEENRGDVENIRKKGSEIVNYNLDHVEPVPDHYKDTYEDKGDCMKVRNLVKDFGGHRAVDNLSLTMYKDQIFALLGHNGAGKTTTISMLTGLIDKTKGEATVYNTNIFNEMKRIRGRLGICPQHDVLFEKLTPREHLNLFAVFKGSAPTKSEGEGKKPSASERRAKEVAEILRAVDLEESASHLAKNLSGGQKRKLSVGIAFIGDSDLIMLDEPTSGMDLTARRGMWKMLKTYKQGKIVVLTTHYMDEADYLGDRIAIMAKGQLRCLGSSLFLKNKFGVGYNFTCVKLEGAESLVIEDFVERHFNENYKLLSDVSAEIAFQLPTSEISKFEEFFKELDLRKDELRIESYGISVTTLEEVFLRVGRGEEDIGGNVLKRTSTIAHASQRKGSVIAMEEYSIEKEVEEGACNIFFLHFAAIFLKRLIHTKRNFITLLVEIFMPTLLVLFGLGLTKIPVFFDSDTRWFSPGQYPTAQKSIYNLNGIEQIGTLTTSDFWGYFDKDDFDPQGITLADSDLQTFPLKYAAMNKYCFDNYDESPFRYGSILFDKLDSLSHDYILHLFLNISSQDSAVAFANFYSEGLIKMDSKDENMEVRIANSPLPLTFMTKNLENMKNGNTISFMLGIAFSLVPASIISFIVNERENNLKHQQIISGASIFAYWCSNSVIDLIKTLIPSLLTIALIYAFDVDLPYAWLLILAFSFSIVPFTYSTSFLFKKENAAQNSTLMLHMFCGVFLGPIYMILMLFKTTRPYGKGVAWPLRLIPSFAFSAGIINIANVKMFAFIEGKDSTPHVLSWDAAGRDLFMLVLDIFIYSFLLIAAEKGWLSLKNLAVPKSQKTSNYMAVDDDVVKEEKRMEERMAETNSEHPLAICCKDIRKVYRLGLKETLTAVEKVSFGLDYGQCFALLGTNGAGKTTTFKMLTCDETATHGGIYINGMNLAHNFEKIRRLIGYCPQFDALFMSLTVLENLQFYGKVKRIKKRFVNRLIETVMEELDLLNYRDFQAGSLSGGNKRKLSVACALLGNPPIILMDEPSTGMDPQARRFMWGVIARVSTQRKKSAVILTTHSMEEAEALSTEMGIMVKGTFKCFGSAMHLKNKFGTGYEIEIKIQRPDDAETINFLNQFGLNKSDLIYKENFVRYLKDPNVNLPEMQLELTKTGYACDFENEFSGGRGVKGDMMATFILIEREGKLIQDSMIQQFKSVNIIEHYNNYYKFRVPKADMTIGNVFAFIYNLSLKFPKLQEYSASQTTLEQIFNAFAQESAMKDVGLMRQATIRELLEKLKPNNSFLSTY